MDDLRNLRMTDLMIGNGLFFEQTIVLFVNDITKEMVDDHPMLLVYKHYENI